MEPLLHRKMVQTIQFEDAALRIWGAKLRTKQNIVVAVNWSQGRVFPQVDAVPTNGHHEPPDLLQQCFTETFVLFSVSYASLE